jgi:antitoxin (DNA-binding transcriptional repressor) of toxin-antitoxin stability system
MADSSGKPVKTIELSVPSASEQAIRQGQTEEVVVLQDGRPVALVVPFDEDDLEWYSRERGPAFIESIARAREQAKHGKTVAHDDLKRKLGPE